MLKIATLSVSVLASFLFVTSSAFPQDAKLIEAAKKEGKAIAYGSLESDTMDDIMKAFRKKTGLDIEYWRASATKVMDRALSEARAGRPVADLIITNDNPLRLMQKQDFFQKYESPTWSDFPKDAIDPVLGPRYRNVIIGIVYNKSGIKPADAPKAIEDLVNAKYKGKLVMPDPTQHTTTTQWVTSLHKLMGKEKADKFIRDLAAMKPILVESLLPAGERVSTGETPIAVTYVKYVHIYGEKGAPLDYVRDPKMLGDGHYIGLAAKAPHPSTGKAFIDYFLDNESMKIMAGRGEFVNRKGVYPPLPGADKIGFVEMEDLSTKEFAAKKKEYQQIF
ncbi:MAG TPA: extracellular solute-binding protein, partial [Candidatus Binatia bacterium]|nr:extracellular solute-binding protein [Candidatus Binatia bacterium]